MRPVNIMCAARENSSQRRPPKDLRGSDGPRFGDFDRPRTKVACKLGEQGARLGRRNLVLHRDMQARRRLILRRQQSRKTISDARPDRDQVRAVDPKRNPAPERINSRHGGARRRRIGGDGAEQSRKFLEQRRRQMMEQRDMRREVIAFGREMRAAQRIEVALIGRAHRSSDDDGRGASDASGRGCPRRRLRDGMDGELGRGVRCRPWDALSRCRSLCAQARPASNRLIGSE